MSIRKPGVVIVLGASVASCSLMLDLKDPVEGASADGGDGGTATSTSTDGGTPPAVDGGTASDAAVCNEVECVQSGTTCRPRRCSGNQCVDAPVAPDGTVCGAGGALHCEKGLCVGCSDVNPCPAPGKDAVCDQATKVCGPCKSDGECPADNGVCLPTGACVKCAAGKTSACASPAPICDLSTNKCRACVAADCASPSAPACDPATGACGGCTGDADCARFGATPACNTTTGTCVQCTATNAGACSGTKPVCNAATNTCAPCQTNGDCAGATPLCSPTGACAAWPAGALGDLHVLSGQTVQLTAGGVYDYARITVDANGTLDIVTNGDPALATRWTYIGVAGDLVVNGTIRAKYGEHTGGGPFTELAPGPAGLPDGETVTASITQKAGGAGGRSGWTCANLPTTNLPGGSGASDGNGGGGAGAFLLDQGACGANACAAACGACLVVFDTANGAGNAGTTGVGGNGGNAPNQDRAGIGASAYGMPGGNGGTAFVANVWYDSGGGGGGFRGRHGGLLYLKVRGQILGNGKIDAGGEAGTRGGSGGPGTVSGPGQGNCGGGYRHSSGAGGGGGGAGGSGGKIVLRYKQAPALPISNLVVAGAPGGQGGAALGGEPSAATAAGSPGSQGQDGTKDVAPF